MGAVSFIMTNTMEVWVTRYFISHVKDEKVLEMLKFAENISMQDVEKSKVFLEEADYPLPQPFDENDVDVKAPALYSDDFVLLIKYSLGQLENVTYSRAFNACTNSAIREFYQTSM